MEGTEARHVLEGIHLPLEKMLHHHHHVNDDDKAPPIPVRFNGAGVRSINLFGWDFKVYVAGFYTASNTLESPEDVFESMHESPMQLDFTFLRAVGQAKVTQAWKEQIAHSVDDESSDYEGYERDRDFFINCFGPIENGGTQTVVLLHDGRTVIIDQGVRKGVIEGKNFQKAFLGMWFGGQAVALDLKEGLLGKIHHFGLAPIDHRQQESIVAVG